MKTTRWITGAAVAAAVIAVGAAGCKTTDSSTTPPVSVSTSAPAAPASHTPSKAPAHAVDRVTFKVTGSAADVTYGPAGSTLQGYSGMVKTMKIPAKPPVYYSVTAQLQGGGTVTAEILVNGKVISKTTASGGYNLAMAEITRNILTGQWEDTNTAG